MKILLTFIALEAMLLAPALAQLAVNVEMERSAYVSHEAIIVQISVQNTTGNDIVLGGPSGQSWLNLGVNHMDASVGENKPMAPIQDLKLTPLVLKAGAVTRKQINLTDYYSVADPGRYNVTCSVYFPDLRRWVAAGRRPVFQVNRPRPAFWESTISLPKGHSDAGRYRRYKLFTSKTNAFSPSGATEVQLLYLQIIDEETEENLTTYPISQILTYRDPTPAVDPNQTLHLLYMAAPQVWTYVNIDPDGALKDQKLYQMGKTAPQLMQGSDGRITIRGGKLYDPVAAAEAAKVRNKEIRNLSDRPPGLPKE